MNIEGYRLVDSIGSGGMAIVYRAVQESLGRDVALKVLNPVHCADDQFSQRFLEEGRILASLNHRNIITIHDIGVTGADVPYIAMELLEGGDLRRRMRRGVKPGLAHHYVEVIGAALGHAHERGIVHRDVKPSNILFRTDGTPVLTDFGIAKQLQADRDLTISRTTLGSPSYLSPEQAQCRNVDGRSDLYSLGVILYELLTGEKPFFGESEVDTILQHLNEPAPPLPEPFEAYQPVLDRMLAKAPDERFANVEEMLLALRGVERGQSLLVGGGEVRGAGGRDEAETVVNEQLLEGVPQYAAPPAASHSASRAGPRAAVLAASIALLVPVALQRNSETTAQSTVWMSTFDGAGTSTFDGAGTSTFDGPGMSTFDGPGMSTFNGAGTSTFDGAGMSTFDGAGIPTADGAGMPAGAAARQAAETGVAVAPIAAAEATVAQAALAEPAATRHGSNPGIPGLLDNAEQALAEYRLRTPAGDSAYDHYTKILTLDPGNPQAQAGLDRIAELYSSLAEKQLAAGHARHAGVYVRRGLQIEPDHPTLLALAEQVREERSQATTLASQDGSASSEPGSRIKGETPAELFRRIKRWFQRNSGSAPDR
jgi:serine/threonine-protein kinase PpkA